MNCEMITLTVESSLPSAVVWLTLLHEDIHNNHSNALPGSLSSSFVIKPHNQALGSSLTATKSSPWCLLCYIRCFTISSKFPSPASFPTSPLHPASLNVSRLAEYKCTCMAQSLHVHFLPPKNAQLLCSVWPKALDILTLKDSKWSPPHPPHCAPT